MNKHEVFISYHHENDQEAKELLIKMNSQFDLFDGYSVREGDIDDDLEPETIRRIIRDHYIKEATVLLLLCGVETKLRKHIDWEINAAMFNTEKNPRMGILVINLLSIPTQSMRSSDETEEKL